MSGVELRQMAALKGQTDGNNGHGAARPLSIVLAEAVIIYLSVFIIFFFFFTMHENLFFIKINGKLKKMDFMYNKIKCGHF